ncbi:hypothetical protein [Vibrio breoganii]|uniref:hypothetical protein n=1 Tax=Vibrio breoganii TaxID=553239 RepID=UPI000C814B26|nr:hypothetical protein [Vibrio breoganii]PML40428.1 hypothetical protein BCT77_07095 [Vibrio breoganii]PMO77658.1 hypothetical protein BCT02_07520 [Vibrio breoganii]PMO86570.1 hypothetical protein BCS99_11525 [Vibrio breoganii]
MGKSSAQQQRNRANNSGGVAPDAQVIATTLAIALHRKGDSEEVRLRKTATFLTWWMTHSLLENLRIGLILRFVFCVFQP